MGGVINIGVWLRRGVQLPRYIHALAALAVILAVAICAAVWVRAKFDLLQCILLVALLPTIVYVTFGYFAWPVMDHREPRDKSGGAA